MKRFSAFILSLALVLSLVSCGGEPRVAHELLGEFTDAYGIYGVMYFPECAEGERGYIDGEFFETMYGTEPDFESDYAVFLSSSIDSIYEAAVFVTRDKSSLLLAEELCRQRLGLLEKMGYADDVVLIKRADTVFYSTFPDAGRAEDIWRDIKI